MGVGEARMWIADGTVGAMGCECAVELGLEDIVLVARKSYSCRPR